MIVPLIGRAVAATGKVPGSHPRRDYGYRLALEPLGGGVKRALDLAIAIPVVVAMIPLLLSLAVLIRLDSPGPALFRQKRSGFRGKAFYIYKFRSMRTASSGEPLRQAQRQDKRVTRIGRVLRRTSIDELPQLINVLRGEMSIVGPRPHAVTHDYDFCSIDAKYPDRFLARPGVTGLAQVSGARGLTDTPEKIRERVSHDLDYVRRWSIWLDLSLLFKTARVVLKDRNAF